MATAAITRPDIFPSGTSVGAYPRSALPPGASAPSGSAVETQPADSARVLFQSLADDTEYIAAAQVGGSWRMVMFHTPSPAQTTGSQAGVIGAVADEYVDNAIYANAAVALSAAISNATAGGTTRGKVGFTAGRTYTISAQVTLRSDLTLDLNGALIQRAAGYGGDLFSASAAVSRVKIQDGRFDNGGSSATGFDFPNGSAEITFRRNRITGHLSTFFNCAAGALLNKNIRVAANEFFGDTTGAAQNQNSIAIWNPYEARVTNNYFEGTGGVTASTSSAAPSTCRHIYVKGNTFKQLNGSAILIRTSGATVLEDIVVSGNTGERLGDLQHLKGLAVVGEAVVTGVSGGITRRATIFGNTVKDFYGNGISCGGGSDGPLCQDFTIAKNEIDAAPIDAPVDTTRGTTGIQLSGVQGFSITSNPIRNCGRGGIRLLAGSNFLGCKGGSIIGNTIDSCGANPNVTAPGPDEEAGILLWQTSQDIEIIGNVVKNTSTVQNGGTGIGLANYADITGITIMGNRCFDNRTPMLQEYGIRIGENTTDAAQPSDITVTNNDCRGNLTAGIKRWETTDHGNVYLNNKGTLVGNAGTIAADALLKRLLSATAALDFPSIAANGQQSLTITVNGCATGDAVFASPDTTLEAGLAWNAWVSAANTVTVRLTNSTAGAIDPASRNWRATVLKF